MTDFSFLIRDNHLPDISYRTDPPEEVVHPRIVYRDNVPYVYCQKQHITLESFIQLLAKNKEGLWVAGYRPSNGKQTTITFSKKSQLTLSPRIKELLENLRSNGTTLLDSFRPDIQDITHAEDTSAIDKPPVTCESGLTLEELERKLALQKEIGDLGEDVAYRYEYARLHQLGCADPKVCIQNISETNVGAGYDLLSHFAGDTRYIEVKSSTSARNEFFISENERKVLLALGHQAFIYLVQVDRSDHRQSTVREIINPFGGDLSIALEPVAWFARLDSKELKDN
jgi:hypothetical protein